MSPIVDGPVSPYCKPLAFQGNVARADLPVSGISPEMVSALPHLPAGECICWGIPFSINERLLLIRDQALNLEISPTTGRWFIFMHTSDIRPLVLNSSGFVYPMKGEGQLGEHAADYVMHFADGVEERVKIRRRFQVGPFTRGWGPNCFEAVPQRKPMPVHASHEQMNANWGSSQERVVNPDHDLWQNWLWAWENPRPEVPVTGFRFEPGEGIILLSAISTSEAVFLPLRWQPRAKACLHLPVSETFRPELDDAGLLKQIQIDMGQVISATRRLVYPNDTWSDGYPNQIPDISANEVLLEYTAHPDACFHLPGGKVISVAQVENENSAGPLRPVKPAFQLVKLSISDRGSGKTVPVKLHVHGEWGEYLAPVDRHRIINPAWFEDYSVDFLHIIWDPQIENLSPSTHSCTYINGETTLKLPLGMVFFEVTKGFEIQPLRRVVEVTPATVEIKLEVNKVLPWRERGWVTADTHVHFLSPISALLEGSAEGVNVVNLLASQWGELMTNVGDFDGKTTWGAVGAGGDGEYLVRVGTENRQHVLGHISLLGYNGGIIAPMTSGGPDESALGDPIEVLLTEWARQCRRQGGVVVLPHFPNPRAEHAASIVSGEIDALEMTAWHDHYSGISPYSLSDWYRYLNCGYLVPAVGGTDKMSASTAVGTVRTYARVDLEMPFTYDTWMDAIRRAETFVTYGPLLEFTVEGRSMGSRMEMPASGGSVDVIWHVASVTVPMTRVDLIVNGEIRASSAITGGDNVLVHPQDASGSWSVRIERSSWLALLVRGHQPDKPEIIAAHSTPVMVLVAGSPMLAARDALTILDQIEGAMAYLDTVGTRAEDRVYKRMRLVLEASHRTLHNRMHQAGHFHAHTVAEDHPEHHQA